jgi:hypothetical protein
MSQGQDKAEILQFSPRVENRDQWARFSFCQQFLDGMTGYVKPKGNTKEKMNGMDQHSQIKQC